MSSPVRELTPRQRKSRSGCKRCKERRVKCDEALPSCHQCRRRGFECPGYNRSLHWIQHRELSGSGLRVITNTKNRSHGQYASIAASPTSFGLDERLWPTSPAVVEVHQRQLDSDLVSSDYPLVALKQDATSVPSETIFHNEIEMDSIESDIRDIVAVNEEDYEEGFIIDLPRSHQSISSNLQDTTTFLVEYYFSNVCPVFSCFDSPSNPFRCEVSNMMRKSPALSNCIQAMSAAHLSELQPCRKREGLEFQNAAVRSISDSIARLAEVSEELMITVIMLGVTQAWHDRRSTGSQHFAGARTLFVPWLSKQVARGPSAWTDLIIPMLIYWEMLASFIMEDGSGIIGYLQSHQPQTANPALPLPTWLSSKGLLRSPTQKIKPHPVTGASPEIFAHFAKVGHLVRKKTLALRAVGRTIDSSDFWYEEELLLPPNILREAEEVEEFLLAYETPQLKDIESTNDTRTPVSDLVHVAEAYRNAALLQIYRAFPSLLMMRLPLVQDKYVDNTILNFAEDEGFGTSTSGTFEDTAEASMDRFLFMLAIKVLKSLGDTCSESGTRTLQPLILVMAANELRISNDRDVNLDSIDPNREPKTVEDWRTVLWGRLVGCVHYISVQPMTTTLDIVKELWKELDSGKRVFWLEVVLEHKWETLMG